VTTPRGRIYEVSALGKLITHAAEWERYFCAQGCLIVRIVGAVVRVTMWAGVERKAAKGAN
jgi:hypothetical protein